MTGVSTGSGVAGTGVRSRLMMRSGSPISAMFSPIVCDVIVLDAGLEQ